MGLTRQSAGFGALAALLVAVSAGAVPANAAPAPVPADIPVALLVDLSTGQHLFQRQIDRRFMPASVTKVMTAYTAFRLIEEGRINPSTPFLISQQLEDEWSGEGSTMFLKAGERPTFGELLLGATTVSGNDASVALAQASTGSVTSWLALMNRYADQLGMTNTHFGSANGFPDEGQTFTSARDLARLGEALVTQFPGLYRRYFGHRTLTWRGLTQVNHDPVTGRVAGADGMKTGFTSEAGYTFIGSARRGGRRLIVVLAAAPTSQLRDNTARALLEWGFSDFTTSLLAGQGVTVGQARVQDGSARHVPLRTARPLRITRPVNTAATPVLSIRYNGPLVAPIAKGDVVANMHVEVAGMPPFSVPLEAAAAVDKANLWQRLGNGLAGLFA